VLFQERRIRRRDGHPRPHAARVKPRLGLSVN
jgi:hypothetical protein